MNMTSITTLTPSTNAVASIKMKANTTTTSKSGTCNRGSLTLMLASHMRVKFAMSQNHSTMLAAARLTVP
jgi:hypothetical protein